MVEVLKQKFAEYGLTYSIGGQISFDVFPQASLQHVIAEQAPKAAKADTGYKAYAESWAKNEQKQQKQQGANSTWPWHGPCCRCQHVNSTSLNMQSKLWLRACLQS
jgi:hypothetical protein